MNKKKIIFYGIFMGIAVILLIFLLIFAGKLIKDNRNITGASESNLIDDNENKDDLADNDQFGNHLSENELSGNASSEADDIEEIPAVGNDLAGNTIDENIPADGYDSDTLASNNNSGDKNVTDIIDKSDETDTAAEDENDPQEENSEGMAFDVRDIEKPKNETNEITCGIDVSKWQGVIDWEKVKDAGVEFAIIRIGYRTQVDGTITEDPYAKYNLQQAQKHGIKLGAYFFSTAVSEKEAKEEAKWVVKFIGPYKITYPVIYNCEGFNDPNSRQYGMTKEERTRLVTVFLDYIKNKGYTPMFYAAKGELEQSRDWDTDTLTKKYKIWVAQYPDSIDMDNPKCSYSGSCDMWQYTSNGSVPGIKGPVDLNIAYFGYEKEAEAKDDTPVEEATADPAALINFKEVDEIVTAKDVTNLRNIPSLENDSKVVAVLHYGDKAERTGIGDNGWSRLKYDGKTLYAITSYLTTDLNYKDNSKPTVENPEAGITFTEVNEKVTAKIKTNLRLVPSTESDDTIVTAIEHGDIAVRTGIGSNGWSRVEYKGKVLYAVTSYLEVVDEDDE